LGKALIWYAAQIPPHVNNPAAPIVNRYKGDGGEFSCRARSNKSDAPQKTQRGKSLHMHQKETKNIADLFFSQRLTCPEKSNNKTLKKPCMGHACFLWVDGSFFSYIIHRF